MLYSRLKVLVCRASRVAGHGSAVESAAFSFLSFLLRAGVETAAMGATAAACRRAAGRRAWQAQRVRQRGVYRHAHDRVRRSAMSGAA